MWSWAEGRYERGRCSCPWLCFCLVLMVNVANHLELLHWACACMIPAVQVRVWIWRKYLCEGDHWNKVLTYITLQVWYGNLHYFNTFVAVCNLNLVQEVRIYCSSDGTWQVCTDTSASLLIFSKCSSCYSNIIQCMIRTLVLIQSHSLCSTVFISSATLTTTIWQDTSCPQLWYTHIPSRKLCLWWKFNQGHYLV